MKRSAISGKRCDSLKSIIHTRQTLDLSAEKETRLSTELFSEVKLCSTSSRTDKANGSDSIQENLIVFGLTETDREKNDIEDVKMLMQAIRVDVSPKEIERIGTIDNQRTRPLKMRMNSLEDKEAVMKRLNLNNADERYRRLSIKDERMEIKSWLHKKQNEETMKIVRSTGRYVDHLAKNYE